MKLLREPLLQFALLGAGLVLVYLLTGDRLGGSPERHIEIDAEEIARLADGFEGQWRRPPTEEELRGLVRSRLREEVLYRQAVAMGLDRDDPVVRRRMAQKLEMLSQDVAPRPDPTDQELRRFFENHGAEYRVPARVTFSHIYFDVDRRGAAAEEDAERLLVELRRSSGQEPVGPAGTAASTAAGDRGGLGDPFPLDREYSLVTPMEVGMIFGDRFAEDLFSLDPGWHGPLRSGYGLHLVHVRQRLDGRDRDLDEIRDRVLADYDRRRVEGARESLFEQLSARYDISIDDEAIRAATTPAP
ncbi:MAG: peptidylprolyl isomerase [Acidobacteriota bacterium]|jgi:hypothetical protein